MRTLARSLLSAGFAFVLAFAMLILENGIIADVSGGVGTVTSVQAGVGIAGAGLVVRGSVCWSSLRVASPRAHRRPGLRPRCGIASLQTASI